jgi:hypothetical protein
VSPVQSELSFYIQEDGIFHIHRRENLKSCKALTGWALYRRRNVSLVRSELGFYIPEDGVLHSHRRENLKSEIDLNNGVFWVVAPCGSCKNRRFRGTWRLLHQGDKIG